MRTTLTLDEDVAALLQQEVHRSGQTFKEVVNRLLRVGLAQAANPVKLKRFVVTPIDTGITAEQWRQWEGRKLEDILEEAERSVAQ